MIMASTHDHKEIAVTDLPSDIVGHGSEQSQITSIVQYLTSPLREAREIFEREYLMAQIKRFHGNVSQTARFVGMERSALHRKMKSLDIFLPDKQDENGENKIQNIKSA